MSDFAVEFVARLMNYHSEPRHRLLGVTMTALVTTMTVIFSVNDVRASCEAQEAAFMAANRYLLETHAITYCNDKSLTAKQTTACTRYNKALEESMKCKQRELQDLQSQLLQGKNDFLNALRIGMTAAEADSAEKESFHNPAGWGRAVNTTVTANGTTEQWVYRFSQSFSGAQDLYLYFQNGVLTAIQK